MATTRPENQAIQEPVEQKPVEQKPQVDALTLALAEKLGVPIDVDQKLADAQAQFDKAKALVDPIREQVHALQAQIAELMAAHKAEFDALDEAARALTQAQAQKQRLSAALNDIQRLMLRGYTPSPQRASSTTGTGSRNVQFVATFQGKRGQNRVLCRNIGDLTAALQNRLGLSVTAGDILDAWRSAGNFGTYRDGGTITIGGVEIEFSGV
jgi:DNA-binding transcriptional MerR regulator